MKTTERFTKAVTKLYNAFHKGELDAMDCKHCAVGNMCDNSKGWVGSHFIGSKTRINMFFENKTGYSPEELRNVELYFIYGGLNKRLPPFINDISNEEVMNGDFSKEKQKEIQFKGLCAVIEYLCELDGIPNVMDYTSLFEFDENGAKKELVL